MSALLNLVEDFETDALPRIAAVLLEHHDMLRLRVTDAGARIIPEETGTVLETVEDVDEDTVREHTQRVQEEIDPATGPMVRMVLFTGQNPP
ncbi:hypothetical protein, partial [Nocardiopsis kunsanensis]